MRCNDLDWIKGPRKLSVARLWIMYNAVWCCCCRWEGVQERCTFPRAVRLTAKPRHALEAGKTRTAPACCELTLSAAFGHALDYLISLVCQTTSLFNFHCLAPAIAHGDRPIDLEPELQARETKAKKWGMAVSGRPTGAFATASLLNERLAAPQLSHAITWLRMASFEARHVQDSERWTSLWRARS